MDFDNSRPVVFREFDAFFIAKGAEKPCPDCGQNDWHIPTSDGEPPPERPVHLTALTDPGSKSFIPTYMAYCGNCGHIKQYHAHTVMKWRESNG